MTCPRCRQENPTAARFCMGCGAGLARRCAQCQTELPAEARFCFACGTPVETPAAATPRDAPEVRTPKHLAERILTSKAALEGERKQVTVLFADLKGSMELLADHDPEEARSVLDPVLDLMMEAVHRYEGTVNQVMGDGIMALFGAPIAHEDHAVRACYAALRMQEAVRRHAEALRRTTGRPVLIRVGLNSGEVVVRAIGSDLKMDYTAVGQTTHLAARMEQAAMPGSTLMTAGTLRLAEGYVEASPLGSIQVKGMAESVETWELTGAGLARTRMHVMARRGFTPFVGRAEETAALHRALDQVRQGQGQVVAVVGEPGVGKSRLFWELTRSPRVHGTLVLESGSVSHGQATPWLPLANLLRAYFQIESVDTARLAAEKVTGRVLTLDRALEASLPALMALVDLPVDGWSELEPNQRRREMREAARRLLVRETQNQPVVLVFEDLHWLDAETQAFLDGLVEGVPTARLLLLVNYRPEYRHDWSRKTYYTQVRLDPLAREGAAELLDSLLGPDPGLAALKSLLLAKTEGNPFFAEECVRTLVETGTIAGESGAYRAARPIGDVHVPGTVQTVLAARIDRLASEDKRLLQAAAAIGKDVPLGLLEAVAGVSEDALRRGLASLQATEFLYEARLFPDVEYTFKHALTHAVAYQSLLRGARQDLHGRIADALRLRYAAMADAQPALVAHHLTECGRTDDAVAAWTRAGDHAIGRSAFREGIAHYRRAVALLEAMPPSPERSRRQLDVHLKLAGPLTAVHGYNAPEGLALHTRSLALSEELGAAEARFEIVEGLWCQHYVGAHLDTAMELGRELLALATSSGDGFRRLRAHAALGCTLSSMGEPVAARQHLERALEDHTPGRDHGMSTAWGADPGVVVLTYLGQRLEVLGYSEQGFSTAERAWEIGGRHPHSLTMGWGLQAMVSALLRRGQPARALDAANRMIALAEEFGFGQWLPQAQAFRAAALSWLGPPQEAIPLLRDALAARLAVGAEVGHPAFSLGLLLAYFRAGETDAAATLADELLAQAERKGERDVVAALHRVRGQCLVLRGDHAAGEAAFHDSLAIARRQEIRAGELMTATELAHLWRSQGRDKDAAALLRPIYGWFTEGFDWPHLRAARALLDELPA